MAKEVQHASQMQRDLLANVSHDLRTPLTLIKGYAETVRDLTGDDKKHRDEQMNIIVDETDRLTALVSSVMELSKVTSGALKCEKVHFDMGQLCDEVSERYDAVCAQNGWQLKLEIPDEELPVCADPDMMQRALHNLLGNAMHHIGEDGIFVLRALRCPEASGWRWKTTAPASLPRTCLYLRPLLPLPLRRGQAGDRPRPLHHQSHLPAARLPLRRPQHCGQRHCVLVHHDRYRRCNCTIKLPTFCLFFQNRISLLMFFLRRL